VYWINSGKYHKESLLGGIDIEGGREDILNQQSGMKVYMKSKNLTVNSTVLPCRNIHTYTWTFLDGRT